TYDIRYSLTNITDGNWASATQVSGEPAPQLAGTSQNMTVNNLSASTLYYFALKTADEVPNTAALSNVVSGTTAVVPDTTAPAAVTNLSISDSSVNSITLTWTAPGDDGSSGTATTYDIRYSLTNITDGNWASATQVSGEPAPQLAGAGQNITISGLAECTTYYFALKTADEVPNTSSISNIPSRRTKDATKPSSQITSPVDNYNYNAVSAIVGTAADNVGGSGVGSVNISIQRLDNLQYWLGSVWGISEFWLSAGGANNWSYTNLPIWTDDIHYRLRSRATDVDGNIEDPSVGNNFYFNSLLPVSQIASPLNNTYANSLADVTGTASVLSGAISQVSVSLKRNSDNKYWDGDSWEDIESWLTTTGTTGWVYHTGNIWSEGSSYLIRSRASTTTQTETPTAGNTFTYDTTPPVTINNLNAAVGANQGSINLSWTAPLDTMSGTNSYQLKYATFDVTVAGTAANWWSAATTYTQAWSPLTANSAESKALTNFNPGLTYYLAIKTQDKAGNLSALSNIASGSTNTPPQVTVTYPSASGLALGSLTTAGNNAGKTSVNITWSVTDPNTADSHTFAVLVSTNSGANYSALISDLPAGTTTYSWNTLAYNNGTSNYKIKVTAADQGGMSGSGESAYAFSLNNENMSPVVTVTYPNGGETLAGAIDLTWISVDANANDQHTFEVLYSTNNGVSFVSLVQSLPNTTTHYLWYSTATVDSNLYRIKVLATDNGATTGYPAKSGEDASDSYFAVNNINEPPNTFNLLSPSNSEKQPEPTPVFKWEPATDPDPGQTLTYTLSIAAKNDFSQPIFTKTGISETHFLTTAAVGLQDEHAYYWQVKATDSGQPALTTECRQNSWQFTVNNAALRITSTNPLDQSKIVSSNLTAISIFFNKRVDPVTLTPDTISLVNGKGEKISFAITYDEVAKKALLVPVAALESAANYLVSLTTGIKDLAGGSLTTDYVFSFISLIETAKGFVYLSQDNMLKIIAAPNVMPANSYLLVKELRPADLAAIQRANEYLLSDYLSRTIGAKNYQIQLLDSADSPVTLGSGYLTMIFGYADQDNDGYLDSNEGHLREEWLRLARLHEASQKWELVGNVTPDTRANTLRVQLSGFSIYTIIAHKAPEKVLSGLLNYPNPFAAGKEKTTIAYALTKDSRVVIKIFDLTGDLVKILEFDPGQEGGKGEENGYTNRVEWDGRNGEGTIAANGAYIAQVNVETSDGKETYQAIRKIAIIK
ncbi:MAG: Ig-like domain-containing protein, partial [Elusimicrobia bacterium]|nr:Ig-like domain-containing protein [Elusimicrobiota bacterium]